MCLTAERRTKRRDFKGSLHICKAAARGYQVLQLIYSSSVCFAGVCSFGFACLTLWHDSCAGLAAAVLTARDTRTAVVNATASGSHTQIQRPPV